MADIAASVLKKGSSSDGGAVRSIIGGYNV